MTYCVGLLVDTGLVLLSDSRTNAGVDQINTFRKMATFHRAHDRVLVLMSAGNLAITQAVVNLLHDAPAGSEAQTAILQAPDMFKAARVVGDALRKIHERDAESLKDQGHEFNGTFILGGQIKGEVNYASVAKEVFLATDTTNLMKEVGLTPPTTTSKAARRNLVSM